MFEQRVEVSWWSEVEGRGVGRVPLCVLNAGVVATTTAQSAGSGTGRAGMGCEPNAKECRQRMSARHVRVRVRGGSGGGEEEDTKDRRADTQREEERERGRERSAPWI